MRSFERLKLTAIQNAGNMANAASFEIFLFIIFSVG